MEINRRTESRLEGIADRMNGSGNSLSGKIKKAAYLVPVVWLAGALSGEFQEEYLEKIGFAKENARYLTIANATIFGLGSSILRYYVGEEASETVGNVSGFLGMAGGTLNALYFSFDAIQSLGRIVYSSLKGKPLISFSPMGILGTGLKKGLKKLS